MAHMQNPAEPTAAQREAREREKLADLVATSLRSPLAHTTALVPRFGTLPEGVTAEQAMEWIRGCEQLGIIEPSPAGHLFMPPGVF